jgi:long-chain fatty acid transport protein
MKFFLATASTIAIGATGAFAGGIDRSGQGVGLLFEPGRVLELSYGSVNPTVEGTDVLGAPTGDVADNYAQVSLSYKYDINDKLSFALNIDQPFGANIEYAASSPLLGGTIASASSEAVTGLLRYKINENFSVHGGLRAQRASASITLQGAAYGGLSG